MLVHGWHPASHLGFVLAIILIDFAVNGEGKGKQPGSRSCHTVEDIYTQTEILLAYVLCPGGVESRFPTSVDKKRGSARKELTWFSTVIFPIGVKCP